MTSSVIVNFGSNASALFKDMNRVKKEVREVAKTATVATKGIKAAAFLPAFTLGGAGRLGGAFSAAMRFGPGAAVGIAGFSAALAVAGKVAEGFGEAVSNYPLFTQAIEAISASLKHMGSVIADNVIPVLQNLAVDTGVVESPYGPITAKQQAEFDQRMVLVKRREADEQAKQIADAQKKLAEIGKKQLAYVKEQTHTLKKMEGDLDRMNTLDPW